MNDTIEKNVINCGAYDLVQVENHVLITDYGFSAILMLKDDFERVIHAYESLKQEQDMSNTTDIRHINVEEVQMFLDNLDVGQEFTVIFTKKDGEQRKITGRLIPSDGPRKENVPIDTDEGIKSFNINRVLLLSRGFND